jgi:hypothetical protein
VRRTLRAALLDWKSAEHQFLVAIDHAIDPQTQIRSATLNLN